MDLPKTFDCLTPEQRADLAAAVADAQRRRRAARERAVERVVRLLPPPLRERARRELLG